MRDSRASLADAMYARLVPLWPEALPLLRHGSCFELLCAVILSAQCTDEQVNRITPRLFAAWPDPASLSKAPVAEVEEAIHSAGFFRTKARHLIESSRIIEERHGGDVPATMEGLLALPGVGRKTANLVLSACFGAPGIIVDTHVLRVCLRTGLAEKGDPAFVEKVIARLVPPERHTSFSHAVNRHGKFVCTARKPSCGGCPLAELCPRIGLP
jgi:endonuclease-3